MLPVRAFAPSRRRNTSGRRLHDDCPGHMRMQGTKVFISARCRECERELVLAIKRLRPEIVRRNHRMGNVILVGPDDCRPRFHVQFLWPEGEVADLDRSVVRPGRCCGQEEYGCNAANAIRQHFDHDRTQPCSGVSMIARRCSFCLNVTLAMPSMLRSLSSGTFIGPGDGADPGAGCGK